MKKEMKFKEVYLERLSDWIQKTQAAQLEKEQIGAHDEAVFEQIRVNVLHIFRQMFEISFKVAQGDNKAPELKAIAAAHEQPADKLYHVYLHFFEKIPKSWHQQRTEAESHGDIDAVAKEDVKLSTMADIRHLFVAIFGEMFDRIPNEEVV